MTQFKKPNIVFIMIDTWRHDALGVAPDRHWLERYGVDKKLRTSNLDQFVGESIYFTEAFAAAPYTTVSVASIMTGAYPPQHGVRGFYKYRLHPSIKTLAEVLHEQGYATIAVQEVPSAIGNFLLSGIDVLRGISEVVGDENELASSEAVNSGRPVFAFIHVWDLHRPFLWSFSNLPRNAWKPLESRHADITARFSLEVPSRDELYELSQRRPMEVERKLFDLESSVRSAIQDPEEHLRYMLDWYIEGVSWFDQFRWPNIVSALKKVGLWDNTILFVFSDHGEGIHPDHRTGSPFAHSQSLLDDELHVPLIIRGVPGIAPCNVDKQVSLVDLFPTVLQLVDINIPYERQAQQSSIFPLAEGQPSWNRYHFAEIWRPTGPSKTVPDNSLCQQLEDQEGIHRRWLVGLNLPDSELYQRCVRSSRFKLYCHDGPLDMRRFTAKYNMPVLTSGSVNRVARFTADVVKRMAKKLLSPLTCNARRKIVGIDERIISDERLYWIDLEQDPEEQNPIRWSDSVPQEVVNMRTALEELYSNACYGPEIQTNNIEEFMVVDRLKALGYLDM